MYKDAELILSLKMRCEKMLWSTCREGGTEKKSESEQESNSRPPVQQEGALSTSGRHDVLFLVPEVSDTRNYVIDVDLDEIELAEERCLTELHRMVVGKNS